MYRNLLARVEAIVPVEHRPLKEKLWEMLQIMWQDRRQAWQMQSDGRYIQRQPEPGSDAPQDIGTAEAMMKLTRKRCRLE